MSWYGSVFNLKNGASWLQNINIKHVTNPKAVAPKLNLNVLDCYDADVAITHGLIANTFVLQTTIRCRNNYLCFNSRFFVLLV